MKVDGYDLINEVPFIEDTKRFLKENEEEIKSEDYDKVFYNLYNSYDINAFIELQVLSLFKNKFNIMPTRYDIRPFYFVTIKKDKLNKIKNETYYIKIDIAYATKDFLNNFSIYPVIIKKFIIPQDAIEYLKDINLKRAIPEGENLEDWVDIYEAYMFV